MTKKYEVREAVDREGYSLFKIGIQDRHAAF
jgi:hypothetical protein